MFPGEFIDELIETAKNFNFSQIAVGRARTREDVAWEYISLALARCAPEVLAEREPLSYAAVFETFFRTALCICIGRAKRDVARKGKRKRGNKSFAGISK